MDDSDYGTIEHTRRAAITSAANLLEAADKAKRLRKRVISTLGLDEEAKDGDRGDFVLELMRLNASYLNRLATLGKRHGGIAQSALEKLYGFMVPPSRREASAELKFTRAERKARFLIRNDASPRNDEARIAPRSFVPSASRDDGTWLKALAGKPKPKLDSKTGEYRVTVPFGGSVELEAEVFDDFVGPRLFQAILAVTLGPVERLISVVIDWRMPDSAGRKSP